MTDLRWDAVMINCHDPESLAAFWAALLGVEVRGRWQQYVGLHPTAPGLPRLVFQRVDDPRPAGTWVHVDLHVASAADLPAAVDRAVGLGARPVETQQQDGQSWQVLADPEDNLFCLVPD
ncbi:MAG: VOC family protein [Actinomycetota bacterium]|nr:VOC family protein [Actinomycetota bacterium]